MAEIALQGLIYQVKEELLAPNPRQRAKDPYPLFAIDRIELEIAITVSQAHGGGIKISVLDFAELSGDRSIEREHAHVVKVSLSPLLSREEILHRALEDPAVKRMVEERATAWIKGSSEFAGGME